MTKRSNYREVLESLPPGPWVACLNTGSGLPGPRANIELAQAFADVADPALIRMGADSQDEYLALWAVAAAWVDGPPLVRRAVAAGVCEPRLLSAPDDARQALEALARITVSVAGSDHGARHTGHFRVLRQGPGYCWGVAIAAARAAGFGCLERWAASDDKDVRWIVRENLKKARLARAAPAAAERVAAVLDRAGE